MALATPRGSLACAALFKKETCHSELRWLSGENCGDFVNRRRLLFNRPAGVEATDDAVPTIR